MIPKSKVVAQKSGQILLDEIVIQTHIPEENLTMNPTTKLN